MKKVDWEGIANRIKQIRRKKGLNQTDFGEKLGGIPQVYISRYERAAAKPSLEFLLKVAELGEVSLDWLILGQQGDF